NANGVAELGYVWNSNSPAAAGFNSGLYPPLNQWSFVALVVQTNQATLYLYYIDPITSQPVLNSAVNPILHSNEMFNVAGTIGTDPVAYTARVFNGYIDDVAVFNSAMTGDQLLAQFSKGVGLSGPVAATIGGQPQSITTYAGNTVKIAATGINGSSPFTYQWQFAGGGNVTDGGNISGAQTPTLTITGASTTNSGTYKLVVTNPVGPTSSSNAVVNIVSPVANSYESVVAGLNPFAFWKLNETSDPSVGGVVAWDYMGGHTGTYQVGALNGFNGIVGPEAPALPGFPASYTALGTVSNTANSYVTASAGNLIATNLTYAMWIKPSGPVENWAGLLMDRGGAGEGLGFGGTVDGTGMSELGYTWNANSTWSWNSSLYPPANQWSFVAMVIEPTKATLYLMNSSGGIQSATNAVAQDSETFGVAWHIGDDAQGGTTGGRTFPGSISDVAVFLSALSPSQVTALYNAGLGNVAPPPVTINIAPAGPGKVTLTWSQGTLLQATNLAGPWTSTSLTSGSTVETTNSSTFFKVQVQ
ncbi:MAG TPA: LamG-like jellyroll fold domain-containing protein, partial [Verrucomicrobiae bacterium]|nr:LamG-like jellyroll fold domain-containing protein [Verrucomicrobiae bacterium]